MPVVPIVVATLAVLAVAGVAVRHIVKLRRALVAERAARRLTAGMHYRDMEAFRVRINALLADRAVVAEAEQVLDTALAAHRMEGGHP